MIRCLRILVFAMSALIVAPLAAQVPKDPASSSESEYATNTGMVTHISPLASWQTPGLWGSDLDMAVMHDARWGLGASTLPVGIFSKVMSLLKRGDTFFKKTGDTFGKIMGSYQEIMKLNEIYQSMRETVKFLDEYQLTVNLFRFLPVVNVMAPDEMGGGQAFAVGFFPKDSNGWEARNNLLNDNPFRRRPGGVRLVEVRYPRTWSDLVMDTSVWGPNTVEEEEMQKMMLAGIYDGVMSMSHWMTNAGINNNLAENFQNIGPKAFDRRINELIARRVAALEDEKRTLHRISTGGADLPSGMTPEQVMARLDAIEKEIRSLEERAKEGYMNVMAHQQVWMRQAAFVNEILGKLEHSKRRLAIMKLNERFGKYQKFWADPDMMNPEPEITGDPKLDKALNLIWNALTVISKGKIPPPTPVSGGPAAKAQATMVRSMYRELLVDELRAVRRILAFRYSSDLQEKAAKVTVEAARQEVDDMFAILEQREERIYRMNEYAKVREKLSPEHNWAFQMNMY